MGEVFKSNAESGADVQVNIRPDQYQPLHDMLIIADSYSKATLLLIGDFIREKNDKKADVEIFPIFFSVNHAIELYLKVINLALNILTGKEEKFTGAHDIRQIWNVVKTRVEAYEKDPERLNRFGEMATELENYVDELYERVDFNRGSKNSSEYTDFSKYEFDSAYNYHFYIEALKNVVVDLEALETIFRSISSNLHSIALDYEETAARA